jgi:hypothetical protein
MKLKRAANRERVARNVRNWRARREAAGYIRIDVYVPQTVVHEMENRGIESPAQLVDWLKIKFRPVAG